MASVAALSILAGLVLAYLLSLGTGRHGPEHGSSAGNAATTEDWAGVLDALPLPVTIARVADSTLLWANRAAAAAGPR